MTEREMAKIEEMQRGLAAIDEIAAELSMHGVTLRRRLLKEHGIVIEGVRACRLVPLGEYQARKKSEAEK